MTRTTRRGLLRAGAATAAGTVVLAASPRAAAQEPVDEWLSNVENYDGTVADRTGESEVQVAVGTRGNGGAFAFDPPAVRVDPGTEVVWEWTGNGGQHNVVAESGAEFSSELVAEAGHAFSRTLDATGVVTYYCQPHRTLGMKGAVVVGSGAGSEGEANGGGTRATAEPAPGSETTEAAAESPTAGAGGTGMAVTLIGGGVVGAALSPLLFGLFLKVAGTGEED